MSTQPIKIEDMRVASDKVFKELESKDREISQLKKDLAEKDKAVKHAERVGYDTSVANAGLMAKVERLQKDKEELLAKIEILKLDIVDLKDQIFNSKA